MRTTLLSSLLFVALAGGCTTTGTGSAMFTADVAPPPLVYVDADVQVIEDYDEPVFYSSNMYWRFDNGVWYRSRYHTRDWVRVEVVPAQIRRIDRPQAYVHFRGNGNARGGVKQEIREERREDKREIKEERKDDRQDAKEERREIKEERKDDRRDAKEERKEERHEIKEERKDDRRDAKEERKEERKDAKDDRKDDKKKHH
jgi:hypothetical protein